MLQAVNQKILVSAQGPCEDAPGKEKKCEMDVDLCTDPQVADEMRRECPKTCGVCGKGIKYHPIAGDALPLTPIDAVVFRARDAVKKSGEGVKQAITEFKLKKSEESIA